MESFAVRVFCFVLSLVAIGTAQEVISLYAGTAPGSTQENYPEKQYFSKVWNTDVVTNVTRPTLTVFQTFSGVEKWHRSRYLPRGQFMAIVWGR
jgi:hypothetical protein